MSEDINEKWSTGASQLIGTLSAAQIERRSHNSVAFKTGGLTAITIKNAVFWEIKSLFVPQRKHFTSPLQSSIS
jgi:hypothetical protein